MKATNADTGHNRFLRFSGLTGDRDMPELVVELRYLPGEQQRPVNGRQPSPGEMAVILDGEIVPAVVASVNLMTDYPWQAGDPVWWVEAGQVFRADVLEVRRHALWVRTPFAGAGVPRGTPRSLLPGDAFPTRAAAEAFLKGKS